MKRPPLSLKADRFAAHAVPQPDPVQVATATASPAPVPQTSARNREAKGSSQSSRAGKVQVVTWITEERRSELKIVAVRLRRTVDDLLSSMIDDLIKANLP